MKLILRSKSVLEMLAWRHNLAAIVLGRTWVALLLLSAGCLSAVPQEKWAHPECEGLEHVFTAFGPGAWTNVSGGERHAAFPGWPLPDGRAPGVGANVTDIAWRPDGKDPYGADTHESGQANGHRLGPVIYRLTWSEPGHDGPLAMAEYDHDASLALVASDAHEFLDAVGYPGDKKAWVADFIASQHDSGFGPVVVQMDGPSGSGTATSTGSPAVRGFSLAWRDSSVGVRVVDRLQGEWSDSLLWSGQWNASIRSSNGLSAAVNYPTRAFVENGANYSILLELNSANGIWGRVQAPQANQNFSKEALAASQRIGLKASHWTWQEPWPAYWCDPDTGLRQSADNMPTHSVVATT